MRKLCKIANILTATVPHEATLADTMRSLLSYVRAFDKVFVLRFVDVRITDVMKDRLFSNLLADNTRTTVIRYIRVHKIMMKHQDVLTLLGKLRKDAPSSKAAGMTLLDDANILFSRR